MTKRTDVSPLCSYKTTAFKFWVCEKKARFVYNPKAHIHNSVESPPTELHNALAASRVLLQLSQP